MNKVFRLIGLCILSIAIVSVAHYYEWDLYGWSRLLLAAPIFYAGLNFRRPAASSIAMILLLAQGPLIVIRFARISAFPAEHVISVLAVSVVSVILSYILRKERESGETLENTHGMIRSLRSSIDEENLLAMLEQIFMEKGKTGDVAIYVFGDDGGLRPRTDPGANRLPPEHIFYKVAESREFMASANPAQDSRLVYYGTDRERASISQLVVFPIEYGGRVRAVISIANAESELLEKESFEFLTAMLHSVENTLELSEKLRDRINHEIQKNKIRDTFSSYLSRTVAEEILKDPEKLDLGGEVRNVTVMFTEVTNFKELMKALKPEELLSRLNAFFSVAMDTIFEYNGTLDKFIGDNIMAFWGAPLAIPDSECRAVACAQKLQKKVMELNSKWQRAGAEPFHVCIGINSGPVVAGNIGSIRRMEYTVIGDTVNLAARIKSLSHTGNIPVLVSESVQAETSGDFRFAEPFQTKVKGKSQATTVYPLLFENSD